MEDIKKETAANTEQNNENSLLDNAEIVRLTKRIRVFEIGAVEAVEKNINDEVLVSKADALLLIGNGSAEKVS